jgi:serine/threonine protein kinase/Tol biopolymer transport system component
MTGKNIGHYEILEKLGEGGMGVVYKARDTRLNRFVALKLLPAQKLADEDRLRRFTQEAHTASALNHPNIITIHDIGTDNGEAYIVMEYIAGKTLDQLIPRRGMRLAEVLKISAQAADALAAAAAAGVIHRDVKPGNIMVTDSGLVKVLDFGLAKLSELATNAEAATATIAGDDRPRTREGTVIGTVSYMSPEQAEGKPLDPRSDIFSFGAVLYEMVTGQRAFRGETSMSTISSILRDDPKPAAEIAGDVPRDLERIIARCLRKDPSRRFQNMADVRVALLELKEETESGKVAAPFVAPRKSRALWPYAAAAALLGAGATFFFLRPGTTVQEAQLTATVIVSSSGTQSGPTFSPDGNQIAFAWTGDQGDVSHIYVKLIGSDTPLRLTSAAEADFAPAWAPNGKSIAFWRQTGVIYTISPIGGAERRIAEIQAMRLGLQQVAVSGSRISWSQDSKWLLVSGRETANQPSRVIRISVDTGEKTVVPLGENRDLAYSTLSPDSRKLAFDRIIGDLVAQPMLVELDEGLQPKGDAKPLQPPIGWRPTFAWTADSRRIVSSTSGGLRILSTDGSAPRDLPLSVDGVSKPAVSMQGNRMALVRSFSDINVWRGPVLGPGKLGESAGFITSPRTDQVREHAYSPDGRKIAFESNRANNATNIWISDADGANPILLAGGSTLNGSPSWSPDGRWIAFDSRRDGNGEIYVVSADGGAPRRLTNHPADDLIPCWSQDGKWIYFVSTRNGNADLFRVPPAGGEPEQITHSGAWAPHESPDGKFIYYTRRLVTSSMLFTAAKSPLFRIPADGGEETQVLDSVCDREWVVTEQGIWFIWPTAHSRAEGRYFDFATRKTNVAATINKPVTIGLAMSPDGRYLLYNQIDHSGSELLLVENFR